MLSLRALNRRDSRIRVVDHDVLLTLTRTLITREQKAKAFSEVTEMGGTTYIHNGEGPDRRTRWTRG